MNEPAHSRGLTIDVGELYAAGRPMAASATHAGTTSSTSNNAAGDVHRFRRLSSDALAFREDERDQRRRRFRRVPVAVDPNSAGWYLDAERTQPGEEDGHGGQCDHPDCPMW